MKKAMICVLFVVLILMQSAAFGAENENLTDMLLRMMKGNLTAEEEEYDQELFDSIPKEFTDSLYLFATSSADYINEKIEAGVLSEAQAKALCARIGLEQREAERDCIWCRNVYTGKKDKKTYITDVAISFSAGMAIYSSSATIKYGKVTGNRDTEIWVEWTDGTAGFYEYGTTSGKGKLWYIPGYDSFDEVGEEVDKNLLFFNLNSMFRKIRDKNLTPSDNPDSIHKGDLIFFGNYPQGLDETAAEPIEWLVIDKDGTKVKLLSKHCLSMKRFHEKDVKVSWPKSDLRKWLNGAFMKQAFSAKEQKCLIAVKHEGASDKVSLITQKEAEDIFPGYSAYIHHSSDYADMLYAEYTLYAMITNEDRNEGMEMAGKAPGYERRDDWWTCNVDPKEKDWVFCEDKYNTGLTWTTRKNDRYAGVRPIIQIDLTKAEYFVQRDEPDDTPTD